jgi:hypothetical protein
MDYLAQDILYIAMGIVFAMVLLGYIAYRRHWPGGGYLLALVFLLTTTGLADIIFRWNPNPSVVLLAGSLNVLCFLLNLTILLHYSVENYLKSKIGLEPLWLFLILYLPALLVSGIYTLTPLMISGIITSAIGFQPIYGSGYWTLVGYGAALFLLTLHFNIMTLVRGKLEEKNQSVFLMFVLFLLGYFYCSVLIFPFIYRTVNFASPLPTTFAILVLVYAYIHYHYFSMGEL